MEFITIIISLGLSVYQILLKKGLDKGHEIKGGWIKYLFIWQFITANSLMLIFGFLWALVLQKSEFIKVYPLLSFAYIWSMILARIVLREHISWNKVLGVILIITGIVVANA